jgi:hypothetical protein
MGNTSRRLKDTYTVTFIFARSETSLSLGD